MESVIDKIYLGEEIFVPGVDDEEYKKAMDDYQALSDEFISHLTTEEQECFGLLQESHSLLTSVIEKYAFWQGVKAGARLMLEMLR